VRSLAHPLLTPTVAIGSPIQAYLERVYDRHRDLVSGEVATYIPELGKADPEWFGIGLATTDGRVYEVGDSRQTFTIQSISKPITYGIALEDHGHEAVLAKVGVEPTGDAFNSISLHPETGCPLNPMINAGAITTTSLVAGTSAEDRLERLLGVFSLYAGRKLAIDESVYRSEKETGHRNRAIGHMLRNFDVLTEHPDPALDLYFRQCSILVDCRDLAMIAATLANGGVNPVTGERAVPAALVASILSVMATCGMYDFAGEWMYAVGLPAKSGVAGGVLAVLPGQLGIGVFSPRLDARGNSVRGVAVCTDVSRDFNLHSLRVARSARSVVRAEWDVAALRSRRLRPDSERLVLDANGKRARIFALQGDLSFPAVEVVIRRIVDASAELDAVVLDLRRVARTEDGTLAVLAELVGNLVDAETPLVLVGVEAHARFVRQLQERLVAERGTSALLTLPDLDAALEWCEERILGGHGREESAVPLREHAIAAELCGDGLKALRSVLIPANFAAGATIVREGDRAEEIFLLMHGRVSVTVDIPGGHRKRLATVTPGMIFGEITVVDRSQRTADVRADTAVECLVLPAAALERLGETNPPVAMAVMRNLLRNCHRTVNRLSREVAALEG